ncbi:unnamed protein product, partial [Rotaria sp. Silwood1]
MTSHTDDGVYK